MIDVAQHVALDWLLYDWWRGKCDGVLCCRRYIFYRFMENWRENFLSFRSHVCRLRTIGVICQRQDTMHTSGIAM